MVFKTRAWLSLSLALGLWLSAGPGRAETAGGAQMALGPAAKPPPGFAAFCLRRPDACGGDARWVSEQARRFAGRRPFAAAPSAAPIAAAPSATGTPAGLPPGWSAPPELLLASVERAPLVLTFDFLDPQAAAEARAAEPLAVTPELWTLLKTVNAQVNAALASREDRQAFGVADYWDLPLAAGRNTGDCEDYVLEKRRALLAAGVEARRLNIALAATRWGETHAVLLVETRQGDYVLDNLTPWIRRWNATDYRWLQRQVRGEAFAWAKVRGAA